MLSINSLRQQYIFTSKEIQGIDDIEFLIHLKTLLKEARGLRQFSATMPGQDLLLHRQSHSHSDWSNKLGHSIDKHEHTEHSDPSAEAVSSKNITINSLIAQNRAAVAEILSSREWLSIKRRYGFHRGDIKVELVRQPEDKGFSFEKDFQQYTDRINELDEYFGIVADRSNLILDPEIDTYYLTLLTTSTLPSIADLIALSRGQRVDYDLRKKTSQMNTDKKNEVFLRLSNLLDYQLSSLNRTINILGYASPESYKSLKINRLNLVDKINDLSFGIRSKDSMGFDAAVEHWNESTQLLELLQSIQFNGMSVLRWRLEERRRNIGLEILLISILLLTGSLIIFFVNNRLFGRLANALTDIKMLANTDSLTKLLSRRSLPHLYQRAITGEDSNSEGIGLCIFDVDYFKLFNDNYGHLEGDDALVKVATFVKDSLLRQTDYAFRFGGEEFLIILSSSSLKKFEYFLQSIRRGIENLQIKHKASSTSDYLTVSMGGVYIPQRSSEIKLDVALLQADRELYKVKQSSRNAVSITTLTDKMASELKKELDCNTDRRTG
ncbi:hypothetical protein KR52_11435 [Synechococcus sp. KORDI-52]|nr:hypothetical protein KR52_11435 [Synechococcus sp. KORDI-52]